MILRVTATSHWTADRGPLRAGSSAELGQSRFARMVAHVLEGIGARAGEETAWIVGTRHGPWAGLADARADAAATVDAIASDLGHQGPTTIVSAGARTIAMALLEAAACTSTRPAVVVIAEESTPIAMRAPTHDGFAVALRVENGRTDVPRLGVPTRRAELARPTVPAAFAACPLWAGLTLVHAIEGRAWGWHALEAQALPRQSVWAVELSAPSSPPAPPAARQP